MPLVKKGSVGELRMYSTHICTYSMSGPCLEIVLGLVCVCRGGGGDNLNIVSRG